MSRRTRVRLLGAAVTAVLAVTGCSAEEEPEAAPSAVASPLPTLESGPVSVPDGWQTYEGTGWTIAHPAAWEITERDTPDGPVVVVEGPAGEGELPRQVVVASQPDFAGDLEGLVAAFEPLRELPEQRVVQDEDVALEGAREARVTERTFSAPAAGGTSVPARVLELRLITDQSTAVGVVVRSAESDFAGAELREVFATFRVV